MANNAKKLRQQALELLCQAESLDRKKPYLVICTGGYDQPTTTVLWEKSEPSESAAAKRMGFTKSDMKSGEYDVTVQAVSLSELVPA